MKVYSMVKDLIEGNTLSKSVSHTSLVLILKKNIIEGFIDLSPVNRRNFIN